MELVGIVSAIAILGAFLAIQLGWVTSRDIRYDAVNFLSSIGMFAYAHSLGSIPFMITNVVWGVVSGIDVARYMLGHRPHKQHQPRLD